MNCTRYNEVVRSVAHSYARQLGWAVFPCSGKAPAIPKSTGCKEASLGSRAIDDLWNTAEAHHLDRPLNIGVACGGVSGFWALDVDVSDNGKSSLRGLIRDNRGIPRTPVQVTGTGGLHYLFAHNGEIRNKVRFRPGLDVRSDGGYIVVAPSVHPDTKVAYRWEIKPSEQRIARAPEWLIDILHERDFKMPSDWEEIVDQEIGEGCRNDHMARITGHLLRKNVNPAIAMSMIIGYNEYYCDPPLDREEVDQVFHSIYQTEVRRRNE